jgi:hypothetical protein
MRRKNGFDYNRRKPKSKKDAGAEREAKECCARHAKREVKRGAQRREEDSEMPELPDIVVYIEALERRIAGHVLWQLSISIAARLRSPRQEQKSEHLSISSKEKRTWPSSMPEGSTRFHLCTSNSRRY